MPANHHNLIRIVRAVSSPAVVFYTLPYIMLLLFLGTISQRYIGLYESDKLFFSSFITWLGPIPMPGMYFACGVIAVGLVAKLIFRSPWHKASVGIIITHMGALLLLAGGLVTAYSSREGFISLEEGETGNHASYYHRRELAILRNGEAIFTIPAKQLKSGLVIESGTIPFTVSITNYCHNCSGIPRKTETPSLTGIAKKVELIETAPMHEEEQNQSGAEFSVRDKNNHSLGAYLTFEALPSRHQPELEIAGDKYRILIRREPWELPFSIRLEDFSKDNHPGTEMARSYQSMVTILDGGAEWKQLIAMNEPLRYKGHTIYQSSFSSANGLEISVLAVVKNSGRMFPYVSSIAMCAGLLIHLIIRQKLARK